MVLSSCGLALSPCGRIRDCCCVLGCLSSGWTYTGSLAITQCRVGVRGRGWGGGKGWALFMIEQQFRDTGLAP